MLKNTTILLLFVTATCSLSAMEKTKTQQNNAQTTKKEQLPIAIQEIQNCLSQAHILNCHIVGLEMAKQKNTDEIAKQISKAAELGLKAVTLAETLCLQNDDQAIATIFAQTDIFKNDDDLYHPVSIYDSFKKLAGSNKRAAYLLCRLQKDKLSTENRDFLLNYLSFACSEVPMASAWLIELETDIATIIEISNLAESRFAKLCSSTKMSTVEKASIIKKMVHRLQELWEQKPTPEFLEQESTLEFWKQKQKKILIPLVKWSLKDSQPALYKIFKRAEELNAFEEIKEVVTCCFNGLSQYASADPACAHLIGCLLWRIATPAFPNSIDGPNVTGEPNVTGGPKITAKPTIAETHKNEKKLKSHAWHFWNKAVDLQYRPALWHTLAKLHEFPVVKKDDSEARHKATQQFIEITKWLIKNAASFPVERLIVREAVKNFSVAALSSEEHSAVASIYAVGIPGFVEPNEGLAVTLYKCFYTRAFIENNAGCPNKSGCYVAVNGDKKFSHGAFYKKNLEQLGAIDNPDALCKSKALIELLHLIIDPQTSKKLTPASSVMLAPLPMQLTTSEGELSRNKDSKTNPKPTGSDSKQRPSKNKDSDKTVATSNASTTAGRLMGSCEAYEGLAQIYAHGRPGIQPDTEQLVAICSLVQEELPATDIKKFLEKTKLPTLLDTGKHAAAHPYIISAMLSTGQAMHSKDLAELYRRIEEIIAKATSPVDAIIYARIMVDGGIKFAIAQNWLSAGVYFAHLALKHFRASNYDIVTPLSGYQMTERAFEALATSLAARARNEAPPFFSEENDLHALHKDIRVLLDKGTACPLTGKLLAAAKRIHALILFLTDSEYLGNNFLKGIEILNDGDPINVDIMKGICHATQLYLQLLDTSSNQPLIALRDVSPDNKKRMGRFSHHNKPDQERPTRALLHYDGEDALTRHLLKKTAKGTVEQKEIIREENVTKNTILIIRLYLSLATLYACCGNSVCAINAIKRALIFVRIKASKHYEQLYQNDIFEKLAALIESGILNERLDCEPILHTSLCFTAYYNLLSKLVQNTANQALFAQKAEDVFNRQREALPFLTHIYSAFEWAINGIIQQDMPTCTEHFFAAMRIMETRKLNQLENECLDLTITHLLKLFAQGDIKENNDFRGYLELVKKGRYLFSTGNPGSFAVNLTQGS